jgi:hypothetical protein
VRNFQLLTMDLFLAQRPLARRATDITVNIKESVMKGPTIVELGRASTETRQPVYPPIWFDGVSFQFFKPL